MPTFTPEVNKEAEFYEISSDFGNPDEIIREAISNSFDAKATDIEISAVIDKSSGTDELVVTIIDNGEGMDEEQLHAFFTLGFSTRRKKDALGRKATDTIGEKGHGTKVYFNSRQIHSASEATQQSRKQVDKDSCEYFSQSEDNRYCPRVRR